MSVDKAANGHVWIYAESKREFRRIRRFLMFRYGFWRWGSWIPPITDEGIYPDYRRGHLRIHSGWDIWIGFDFLSANTETDQFLDAFIRCHLPDCTERAK
jgi:hypothetical protein